MSLFQSEYKLKVSFEDLDPMCVVWHGNYMRYMERARCDLFSKLNYTYKDMKKDNYAYPVAKMTVKYIKPAFFEDELLIKTEIVSLNPSLDIKYTIYNQNNEKIFTATTMQIAFDINSKETLYEPPKNLVLAIGRQNEKN